MQVNGASGEQYPSSPSIHQGDILYNAKLNSIYQQQCPTGISYIQ